MTLYSAAENTNIALPDSADINTYQRSYLQKHLYKGLNFAFTYFHSCLLKYPDKDKDE